MLPTMLAAPADDTVQVREVVVPHPLERVSRRSHSVKNKLAILAEYERVVQEGKGALLRQAGFVQVADHASCLRRWEG